jgi:hypothetical protein
MRPIAASVALRAVCLFTNWLATRPYIGAGHCVFLAAEVEFFVIEKCGLRINLVQRTLP